MRPRRSSLRPAILAPALALACALPGGSSPSALGDALPSRFPGQAARVLGAARPFDAVQEGFSTDPRGGVRAELPRRGEGALRFDAGPGVSIGVREVGAGGEGQTVGRAVAYPRSGGTSFWAAEEKGYEEWLLLDPGAVRRGAPVAAWEIEGATARQRGEAVELLDTRGAAQIVVSAPEAYAAGGRPVAARLAALGSRIELSVDAEGEEVLVDPAWRRVGARTNRGRFGHTAATLPDGRVLVVGGSDGDGKCPSLLDNLTLTLTHCALDTTDLYDPATSTWTQGNPMKTPRMGHAMAMTQTRSGHVYYLVSGGFHVKGSEIAAEEVISTASAELFDPIDGTWHAAAPMRTARSFHTATMLDDHRVLVTGGIALLAPTNPPYIPVVTSAEVYDPDTDTWSCANGEHYVKEKDTFVCRAMPYPMKLGHTATVIDNPLAQGMVLVTGGLDATGAISTRAQIYNPATSQWATFASMTVPRYSHTATMLDDGDVLVTGGNTVLASTTAELFHLVKANSAAWIVTTSMNAPRFGHTATKLSDGRVFVAGGSELGETSAEVYDSTQPVVPSWTPLPPTNEFRLGHTASLLHDDSVLLVGGSDPSALQSAERYDVSTRNWTPVADLIPAPDDPKPLSLPPISARRAGHTATLLDDGHVLVAGGQADTTSPSTIRGSVEIFVPGAPVVAGAGTWSLGLHLDLPRSAHTATSLGGGQVLVAGGMIDLDLIMMGHQDVNSNVTEGAELFDPSGPLWIQSFMNTTRLSHTATLLGDGRVLVAGGSDGFGFLAEAETFDPRTGEWTTTHEPMNAPRTLHAAALLQDGRVLVTGGADTSTAEVYDPTNDSWKPVASMSTVRSEHTATLLDDGRVLVTGGRGTTQTAMNATELYDPRTDAWSVGLPMNHGRYGHAAVRLAGGLVLVTGGNDSSAEVFDPSDGSWTLVSSMTVDRRFPAVTPLADGRVLAVGGTEGNTATGLASAEVFGPQPAGAVCAKSMECASGACFGGICCEAACTGGCVSCSIADRTWEDRYKPDGVCTLTAPCGTFACRSGGPSPSCYETCGTSAECAPGFACAPDGTCIAPQSSFTDDACAVSPERPGGPLPERPLPPAALLLAALTALGRRTSLRAGGRRRP